MVITGHVHLLVGVPRCALPRPDSDAVEVVLCSPPKRLSSREIAPLSNRPRGGQRSARRKICAGQGLSLTRDSSPLYRTEVLPLTSLPPYR